jgi:hypothetical protein
MGKNSDAGHAFVTYARANSAIVLSTIEKITKSGFKLWYDKGITPSSTWTDEIANAIIDSSIVIAFISKEAMESAYVRNEIEFALSKQKKILPVYLDGMEILPPGLALVLNTTQGVMGKKNTDEIAEQICAGLEFYGDTGKGAVEVKTVRKPRRRGLITALAAAFVMILAIAGYFYHNSSQPINRNAYEISFNKKEFLPAEPITVRMDNVTKAMTDSAALIGIWNAGDKGSKYISFAYIKEGDIKLRAPVPAGIYELRAYSSDKITPQTLRTVDKFNVSENSMGAFKLSADKKAYEAGERIVVNVEEVPQFMLSDGAVTGIYKLGAESKNYLSAFFLRSRDQEFFFDAPQEGGVYEIRAYTNDIRSEETLAARVTLNVSPAQDEEVSDDDKIPDGTYGGQVDDSALNELKRYP